MDDDDLRHGEGLERLTREVRRLRWTVVVCTAAICFALAGDRDAGVVLFLVVLVGGCAYSLLRILSSAGDYLVARRRSRGESAD